MERLRAVLEIASRFEQSFPHPDNHPVGGNEILLRPIVDRSHREAYGDVLGQETLNSGEALVHSGAVLAPTFLLGPAVTTVHIRGRRPGLPTQILLARVFIGHRN